jgi:RNA polymerase sigma factor (sigma-70 family)
MGRRKYHKLDRLSDRQIVDMLLANDSDAVEYVFFHRCDKMFSHIIKTIFQSQGKKEELITELYLYLSEDDWRRLRQFEFRSELNTWLSVVAIRFFSKKKLFFLTNTEQLDALINEDGDDIPDEYDFLDDISKIELYRVIETLPKPRERLALLGTLAGKKAEVIAEELGCTVIAVYNLIKRAKMAVKQKLKGKDR